ncbi:MAG: hypothetical protein H6738_08985 [Alphaproteobacteria bacterium]|nr:hypothetical protein [Alphaproteobacteria bacterium]
MWRALCVLLLCLQVLCPSSAWAQGVGSFVSPGPLARVHSEIDTLTGCPKCHAPGRGPTPDRCMACHDSVKQQVASGSGFHADKGATCGNCHPDHRGRDFKLIRIEESGFDHDATGFPLKGAHANTRCQSCHKDPKDYTGLSQVCATCHEDPHGGKASSRDLLQTCDTCHDADDWDALPLPASVFDHTSKTFTDYLLEGQHRDVECVGCHVRMKFVPTDSDLCTDCHVNPHRASFKDDRCEDCHPNSERWTVPKFDHNLTRYRLVGAHRKVGCDGCHGTHRTDPLPYQRCTGCHEDVHHGQFDPKPCDDCHTVESFSMRDFDHDRTDFPLKGQHATKDCEQCHGQGNEARYVDLAHADCDDCHEDEHRGRFQPTNCKACHIEDGFQLQVFDHDETGFPQTGKHVGLDCNKCHRDFQWNGIPHDSCVDCHYTKNPHRPVITADQCDGCHTTESFDDITFDHAANTTFDLSPQHVRNDCTSCHTYIYHFAGLDKNCTACHNDDRPWGHYTGQCGTCHLSDHWYPGGLGDNDHAVTGFPLKGAHSLLPCESCHPPGRPRGDAQAGCSSCHWQDDMHQNLLGSACDDCHNEMSWHRTSFRHTMTGWPLRGAHRLAACVDCHATGYIGTPTDCIRCHENQASPAIPAHQTASFPTCDLCHRPYTWDAPGYPH